MHPLVISIGRSCKISICTIAFCYRLAVFIFGVVECTVLYCIVLYCTVLYCNVLYCIVLYCVVLYCNVLYFVNKPLPWYVVLSYTGPRMRNCLKSEHLPETKSRANERL